MPGLTDAEWGGTQLPCTLSAATLQAWTSSCSDGDPLRQCDSNVTISAVRQVDSKVSYGGWGSVWEHVVLCFVSSGDRVSGRAGDRAENTPGRPALK